MRSIYMNENINQKVNKVNRAMSQEGMPLTEEEKKDIKEVISGKKTVEQKVKEIIDLSIKENEKGKKR